MSYNIPEMPQHLILALDRHQTLLDAARRHRAAQLLRHAHGELPLRQRRLRRVSVWVGDLLITLGQRLGANATGAPDATTRPVMRVLKESKSI